MLTWSNFFTDLWIILLKTRTRNMLIFSSVGIWRQRMEKECYWKTKCLQRCYKKRIFVCRFNSQKWLCIFCNTTFVSNWKGIFRHFLSVNYSRIFLFVPFPGWWSTVLLVFWKWHLCRILLFRGTVKLEKYLTATLPFIIGWELILQPGL